MDLNRRNFLKGAAVASVVAAGSLAVGCTPAEEEPAEKWEYDVDVAVAGFGAGGAMAALTAQKGGASVVCVEAYHQVGGTAMDSAGGATGPGSMEVAQANMPYSKPEFLQTFVDCIGEATNVMEEYDAFIRPGAGGVGFTIGAESTHKARVECYEDLAEKFVDGGGVLLMETKAFKLLTNEDGSIVGLMARKSDGTEIKIKAKAVILACGGFQNNPELKTKFFGPMGDQVFCRAVPTNDGTGLLMAKEVGAALSTGLGTFYGHSMAANADVEFMDFYEIGSQYHDNRCIVVNLDGKRYYDEGAGVAGDMNNLELINQRYARGCVIFDQNIYDEWGSISAGGDKGADRTAEVIERGGRVAKADTIEELAEKMSAWGYHKANTIKTVKEYNEAIDNGTTADLEVPRTTGLIASIIKIVEPPFYATEVVCGVSCCYGGVAINPNGEVLKEDGVKPIPGLYAIPGTAGGITSAHYYRSSIGAAVAYAWKAATCALDYVSAGQE